MKFWGTKWPTVLIVALVVALICVLTLTAKPAGESEIDQIRNKLAAACKALDEEGFDGDPQMCLDGEGRPYNR